MTFVGISRNEQFSPGRQSGDAAIFKGVVDAIESEGYDVVRLSESILIKEGIPEGLSLGGIFHMTRSEEALSILDKTKDESIPIVNLPSAVRSCRRVVQTEKLSKSIDFPESIILNLDYNRSIPESWNIFPCWVKRGDAHSIESNDVQYATSSEKCNSVLSDFFERGIHSAVLQAHVRGNIVKFYGVRGCGFFNYHLIENQSESKFGLERFNDNGIVHNFVPERLVDIADRAASVLNVDVYGGDAVISSDGGITIIDFNDWPSFYCCVNPAANAIAKLVIKQSYSSHG